MKRFFTILLCGLGAVALALALCLRNNPAKGGLPHNHNPKGMQSDSAQVYLGSLNMTHRALERNLEENVLVTDARPAVQPGTCPRPQRMHRIRRSA